MTRLELVQWVCRKSGINFTGPTATASQSGLYLQAVEWVDNAYEDIQNLHTTWEFLRNEFSKTLTASVGSYTPSALGVSDWGEWAPEDWRLYLSSADEGYLAYIDWAQFKLNYQIGTLATQTGRPFVFSVKPDDTIIFYPIPDDTYTVKGEYFKKPLVMAEGESPVWASNLHLIVGWLALRLYSGDFSDGDKYNNADREYTKRLRQMEKKYLPRVKMGAPLV